MGGRGDKIKGGGWYGAGDGGGGGVGLGTGMYSQGIE